MLPHQHFVVAFVPVVAYVIVRDRRLPTLSLLGVVFFGSQFPDLIDKPLAYQFAVIPSGRVFMHSLPTALPLLLVVGLYGWKTDRIRLSSAYILAHLSHILTDHHGELLRADPEISTALLWPIGPTITGSVTPHWAGPGGIYLHLWTAISIIVLSVSAHVLVRSEKERISVCWGYFARATYYLYRSYYSPRQRASRHR